MFILSELSYVVRIPPHDFDKPLEEAITEQLNNTFSNKVVINVGLCVTLYDILKIDDSFFIPNDGASHTKVTFRYVVFRPFINELIIGRIKSNTPEGITVSLGFFDDILIPPHALPHPSFFDPRERVWVWRYTSRYGYQNWFMDLGSVIRFRVISEIFVDMPKPHFRNSTQTGDSTKSSPFALIGSINEVGLGPLEWWMFAI